MDLVYKRIDKLKKIELKLEKKESNLDFKN
jgi:hypothetical protein